MGSRVDRAALQLGDGGPGEWVDFRNPLDPIAPELQPDGLLVVRREDLDRIPSHPEGAAIERDVIAGILYPHQLGEDGVPPPLLSHRHGHHELAVLHRIAEAVDRADRGHDDDVLSLHQARRSTQPQRLNVLVDGGVLLDIGVGGGNVGLRLVVVVVRDEVLDRAAREERFKLPVELRRQRLVVREHQRRPLVSGDHAGHGDRLSGSGDAEQRLVALAPLEAARQCPDRARLVPRRLER